MSNAGYGGIAPIRVPWLNPGLVSAQPGAGAAPVRSSAPTWLSQYGIDAMPRSIRQTAARGPVGVPADVPAGMRSASPDFARAAAGRQAVVSAQGQLATYSTWSRSMEGRAYQAWRSVQERLPEAVRGTGTWGQGAGLNGVLRGNLPQVAWSRYPAGQVWRYRCNVFATNHTYLAGFAVPTVTRPNDMVRRYEAEIAGRRQLADNVSISRYFERVPLSEARPGDWILCGHRRNGGIDYPHVVLAASGWQDGTLRIAQAGATPKPDQTTIIDRGNGRYDSVNDAGGRISRYEDLYVLRPTRLRSLGPDGRPIHNPRG